MGAYRFERHVRMRTLGFAVVAAVGCFVWFLTASAQASTVPSIESESVSKVASTDATLEAQVNLHEAAAGAYYQFQLAKSPSEFASEILCPSTRPQGAEVCVGPQSPGVPPIGFIPGDTMQAPVWITRSALTSPVPA